MAKDPAFLFYSSDFITGTMFFSDEQVGKYIRLLCAQHQKGHLTKKDMIKICKRYDKDIFGKFEIDENGLYFNVRLDKEVARRKEYSDSRRINRQKKDEDTKKICNSYVPHMETETETINNTLYTTQIKEINKSIETELGIHLTPSMMAFITDFYSFGITEPVFKYAASETAKAGADFRYLEAVLRNLLDAGIKTEDNLTGYKAKREKKKKPDEGDKDNANKWGLEIKSY